MALEKYRAKRDFRITPEPAGGAVRKSRRALAFVIQKHAASHLHYDFRLELNDVLLSWAVPKGPSLDPADKRLAMHVEDHPIEYGRFEGIIPARQYGAGTVMLWDVGSWAPKGDPATDYAKGHLKFELHGEKLKGGWTLLRTNSSTFSGKSGKEAWLLIKEKDSFARAGGVPIVESAPGSAASGRSLDEIAAAREHTWQSKLSAKENVRAGAIGDGRASVSRRAAQTSLAPTTSAPSMSSKAKSAKSIDAKAKDDAASAGIPNGAKRAKLPAQMSPMLATLVSSAPGGDEWIHEIKYDGYRMLCRIHNGKARLFSRNGKDWTDVFRNVAEDFAKVDVRSAWIDGEAVVLDAQGRSGFQALQNALSSRSAAFSFFAFDLLHRDGYDLRGVVLTERKRLLRETLGDGVGAIRMGPELQGHGDEFFKQACTLSLEGAVCKRADSLYLPGVRNRNWVKVKCTRRQEMVIGGYTEPQGSRKGFGALLLGVYADGKLRYAGKVGTGFDDATLRSLHALLTKREQPSPPFVNPPRGYEAKGAHWVRPDLAAEVSFTEWSADGALRHPSFQGLRADKKAAEVVREEPEAVNSRGKSSSALKSSPRPSRAGAAPVRVAGIAISHPEKPYFPAEGVTKLDVARYYEQVAPLILPHIESRPLSLLRCPDGWKGHCFYQKHADKSVNAAVDRMRVPEGDGTATYMGASSAAALVSLVQWGVIELHPWGSRRPRLDRPDRLIFDFDPDDSVGWNDLVTAVGLLRALLDEFKLTGFLKTTGGKGLHVVVPIRATLTWPQAKGFTRAVADFLVRTFSDRFTATVSKSRRKDKIFIDYLRNAEGATAIAPYGVRARAGAPVSMPIDWHDLRKDLRFAHFNVRNAARLINSRKRDPWREFASARQTITRTHGRRVGFEFGAK